MNTQMDCDLLISNNSQSFLVTRLYSVPQENAILLYIKTISSISNFPFQRSQNGYRYIVVDKCNENNSLKIIIF